MKDLSAVLAGLVPVLIIWRVAGLEEAGGFLFFCGLVAVLTCLLIYNLLNYWPHGGLLALLSLGLFPLFYIFVAVEHSVFVPLFLGTAVLAILLTLVGALIAEDWSWQRIGINFSFFTATAIAVATIASQFGHTVVEGALLAVGTFGITRLCGVDLLSWLGRLPGWIYRGLVKLWR